MGTHGVSPSTPAGDDNGHSVVWLHDAADGNDAGPVMCGPVGFGRLLAEALAQAGLTELAVSGVVRRLRRRGPLVDFDFDIAEADLAPDVEAVLPCQLAVDLDDDAVVQGTSVRAWGRLRWDPQKGRLILAVAGLDPIDTADSIGLRRGSSTR
jgi:hypothetical protein